MKENNILEVKNLNVSEKESKKEILKDFSLKLEKGKINILMGPNGSGKSTFANILLKNPDYKITSGKIIFDNQEITKKETKEIANQGIFLSFQNPVEIPGVTLFSFLKTFYVAKNNKNISPFRFKKILEEPLKSLNLEESFLNRPLNEGLSGGEKKKTEILQMIISNPKLAILDEIDSGLDIDSLKLISKEINNFIKKEDKTILLITHNKKILEYLNADKVFIINNGKVIREGSKDLITKIDKYGYKEFLK